jgi:cell division protein FtsB
MKMTYWIVGGIVLAVIAVIAAYSYGRYHPDPDMVGRLTEQIRQETVKQYEKRIADLDKQLKASQTAYIESQKRYDTIIKKIKELKDGKDNIKPPADSAELTARFNNLGYTVTGK